MRTSPQVEDKIIYLAIRNVSYAEIVRRLRNRVKIVSNILTAFRRFQGNFNFENV